MKARHFAGGAGVLLAWLLLLDPAHAQNSSYVRDAAAPVRLKGGTQVNGLSIVLSDYSLPAVLTNRITYSAVDLVMQQCYGGGFGPFLIATPPAVDWTFCSASAAGEEAWVGLSLKAPVCTFITSRGHGGKTRSGAR
jgi:hypothetical protein